MLRGLGFFRGTEEQYYHLLGKTTAAIERPKLEKQEIGQTRRLSKLCASGT
jgi:hypothetical protein